ncbi:hypothetical protein H6P81_014259 [Aristolochia fimbriata]|uniref:Uncharacterized protein n=1 Tax=Aristolochia fimbriata TaxID=158543 RepID=A0AAV7EI62_ARIFI|nr:hypothetical protein H6P81_014259 [Aristolochia fimbriata]
MESDDAQVIFKGLSSCFIIDDIQVSNGSTRTNGIMFNFGGQVDIINYEEGDSVLSSCEHGGVRAWGSMHESGGEAVEVSHSCLEEAENEGILNLVIPGRLEFSGAHRQKYCWSLDLEGNAEKQNCNKFMPREVVYRLPSSMHHVASTYQGRNLVLVSTLCFAIPKYSPFSTLNRYTCGGV